MADITEFENRLRKNARHWGKWARRREIECYRVYDKDIPSFAYAIDVYGSRVHLQEFSGNFESDDSTHSLRLDQVRGITAEAIGINPEHVAVKRRIRQRGLGQYDKTGEQGEDFEVTEGHLRFIVNLGAYLDTGLFLDHRLTRRMVADRARGKRFLNLFAYTGSFTVYAAAGGAEATVSVDLSNTYLEWARRNLALNGLMSPRHRFVREDVFVFLDRAVREGERYDLVVMDPPSFSNSKRMADVLDVQRDHGLLIRKCRQLLSPGGQLFFSTNLRSFRLDPALGSDPLVKDISQTTIPEDFRDRKIHRCWLIQ